MKAFVDALPGEGSLRVQWLPEYRNEDIVTEVFNHVDCLVVPSIWLENAPLVIHEALQARVPVITANAGGMAEYVQDGVNGLLFNYRDVDSLAHQMQRVVNTPALVHRLAKRGYIPSRTGDIPNMVDHAKAIESIYTQLVNDKAISRRSTS